jgi:hypothetical protein
MAANAIMIDARIDSSDVITRHVGVEANDHRSRRIPRSCRMAA